MPIGIASVGSFSPAVLPQSGAGQARAGTPQQDSRQDAPDPAEQRKLDQLAQRDREVRAHEQAHMAAAGDLVTRSASFDFERGADGRQYAVGGDVGIDTSEGRTPEDTIARAQRIRAAASAPAEPSAQDRSVAAQASQMEAKARLDLAQQRRDQAFALGAPESANTQPLSLLLGIA
ncbi:putative metalloprotease CJM1_0395 family protein [Sinimarinibacterium sp. NLF-5-8]|uniref:putative metalloprotease CJM1_0395 family protein n=1 Tax=Sinimarinibacterium sp. NLF-5-8 TaxID=2698684 RepID=UPI00137BBA2F|nr:putative metalloprotease CJM1_0395 family protein [Sinimarinibacterium sp. NLF-5-8]QHS10629.1 hypothetical protein GT972_11105 [Sinimarinibacterium sp. NLF-5-8]